MAKRSWWELTSEKCSQRGENTVEWKDGCGGTLRRYSYDDNHNKQNKLSSSASRRVMSESEQAEEDRRDDDGHGQLFGSATTGAASARKA